MTRTNREHTDAPGVLFGGKAIADVVTEVSHTPNVSDNGTQVSDYENDMNFTDVVTIDGADMLSVTLTYGCESGWDYVYVWKGNHPDYTPSSNGGSAEYVLTGGSHISSSNTVVYEFDGDSVTFGFYSDYSYCDDGYGYYAVVTAETTPPEPDHYVAYHSGTNGMFSNGTDVNIVGYTPSPDVITKYSHTPNVDDEGNASAGYDTYLWFTDVVTIPGATSLHVALTYNVEDDYDEGFCMWAGRHPDYSDNSITDNTRVGYPIEFINNAAIPGVGGIPKVVIFLTADSFGVLPPISMEKVRNVFSTFLENVASIE